MRFKSVLTTLFFILISTCAQAQYIDGTITDVIGEDHMTTISLEYGNPFSRGNKVEIVSTDGENETSVGSFEITNSKGNVINAKPYFLNILPSPNMNVKVVIGSSSDSAGEGKKEIIKDDNGLILDPFVDINYDDVPDHFGFDDIPEVPGVKGDPNFKVEGEVTKVMKREIIIKLNENKIPKPGYTVELSYVTSEDIELDVGKWKVTKVNGQQVTASCLDCETPAREGLKAKITGVPAE